MVELDIVYVSYFGDFLSLGGREFFEQNILFRLSSAKESPTLIKKPPQRPGHANAKPAWPLRNTDLNGVCVIITFKTKLSDRITYSKMRKPIRVGRGLDVRASLGVTLASVLPKPLQHGEYRIRL